jgi:hypothetical protein
MNFTLHTTRWVQGNAPYVSVWEEIVATYLEGVFRYSSVELINTSKMSNDTKKAD